MKGFYILYSLLQDDEDLTGLVQSGTMIMRQGGLVAWDETSNSIAVEEPEEDIQPEAIAQLSA